MESPRFTGAAVVNLDAGELSRSLFSEKVPEDLEIFIMDESGNIICHSGMEYYGQNWSDREDIKKILAGEEHVFKASQDDRLIETSWIKSMQSGFYIVAQSEYVNGIHRFNTIDQCKAFVSGPVGDYRRRAVYLIYFHFFHRTPASD